MTESREQSELRIIYDISVLGVEHRKSASRNGIFRVVEELGSALVASGQCSIELSATASADIHYDSWAFQRHSAIFQNLPFPHPHLQYLARSKLPLLDRRVSESSGVSRMSWKTIRKVARRAARFGESSSANAVASRSLAEADVFHSQLHAIPSEVRKAPQVRSFLTVYDLIGILHPEYFGLRAPEEFFLKKIIDSLTREDWVVCISQKTKDDLCNYRSDLEPNRIFVTPLAASALFSPCNEPAVAEQVRTKYRIPEGPYLLSLCTLEPRKNLPHLIRCFRDLLSQEKLHDLQLVLVGSLGWHYESIFAELEKAGESIRERIILTGRVHNDDLAAVYSGATAFIYPSLYEGFGLPPLEAMQCGVPVITSNTTSLPEVVGDAGLMVDPLDEAELIQAMLRVYADSELRKKLAAASRKQAALFSWQRCAADTMAAYRQAHTGVSSDAQKKVGTN